MERAGARGSAPCRAGPGAARGKTGGGGGTLLREGAGPGGAAGGGTLVGPVPQRRGVSRSKRPGGARRLEHPLSPRTLLGAGKARELAALRRETGADLVLFWNPLTGPQRETLEALTGVDVRDAAALGLGPG